MQINFNGINTNRVRIVSDGVTWNNIRVYGHSSGGCKDWFLRGWGKILLIFGRAQEQVDAVSGKAFYVSVKSLEKAQARTHEKIGRVASGTVVVQMPEEIGRMISDAGVDEVDDEEMQKEALDDADSVVDQSDRESGGKYASASEGSALSSSIGELPAVSSTPPSVSVESPKPAPVIRKIQITTEGGGKIDAELHCFKSGNSVVTKLVINGEVRGSIEAMNQSETVQDPPHVRIFSLKDGRGNGLDIIFEKSIANELVKSVIRDSIANKTTKGRVAFYNVPELTPFWWNLGFRFETHLYKYGSFIRTVHDALTRHRNNLGNMDAGCLDRARAILADEQAIGRKPLGVIDNDYIEKNWYWDKEFPKISVNDLTELEFERVDIHGQLLKYRGNLDAIAKHFINDKEASHILARAKAWLARDRELRTGPPGDIDNAYVQARWDWEASSRPRFESGYMSLPPEAIARWFKELSE